MNMMNKLLGLCVVLLFSTSMMAQTEKVGYVIVEEVLEAMPSYKAAEAKLNNFAETLGTPAMEAKLKEIEAKEAKLQEELPTMSENRKEAEMGELRKLQSEYNKLVSEAQIEQKLNTKNQELLGPVQVEAQKLIEKVAKANGFTAVIEPRGTIIWIEDGRNLLPLIKKQLGVE